MIMMMVMPMISDNDNDGNDDNLLLIRLTMTKITRTIRMVVARKTSNNNIYNINNYHTIINPIVILWIALVATKVTVTIILKMLIKTVFLITAIERPQQH